MADLTPARVCAMTDILAQMHGHLSVGVGDGTCGASQAVSDLLTLILGFQSFDLHDLAKHTNTVKGRMSASWLVASHFSEFYFKLCSAARKEQLPGVFDLKTYLAYFNIGAGGPWQALMHPDFAPVFASMTAGKGALDPWLVYAPPIDNMGQRSVGGARVPGDGVDAAQYAGVGAASVVLSSASWGAPSSIVVTGMARSGRDVIPDRTFRTAAISAAGTFPLSPDTAGDLLISVSSITLPAGLVGGTAIVRGSAPIRATP